jgi:DinB superfamily
MATKRKSKQAAKRKPAKKASVRSSAAAGSGVNDKALREQLQKVLSWREAHADWKQALAGLDPAHRGVRPQGSPHSAWDLLEHVRLAQRDILDFTIDPKHVSPDWPSGYWPKTLAPADDAEWEKSLGEFFRDLKEMEKLVNNPRTDLFARIKHGSGQTILRQAMLLIDHNSYHLGQLVLVRRLLGAW